VFGILDVLYTSKRIILMYGKLSLFLLRIGLGWLFLYAGVVKVLDSEWSAAGYLNNAKTFSGFYQGLASSEILPIINFVNEWGLTLLGISLLLGVFVRVSSLAGILLMVLYYFPAVEMKAFDLFPVLVLPQTSNSVLVDSHIVYALALLVLAAFRAGRTWGLENMVSRNKSWLG
jgi:thiosulfate dehydrogenase (quinone) large subunit